MWYETTLIEYVQIAVVVIFTFIGVSHAICAVGASFIVHDMDGARYFTKWSLPLLAVAVIAFVSPPSTSVLLIGICIVASVLLLARQAVR